MRIHIPSNVTYTVPKSMTRLKHISQKLIAHQNPPNSQSNLLLPVEIPRLVLVTLLVQTPEVKEPELKYLVPQVQHKWNLQ